MKCQYCGAENPDIAKFCYKCGKPVVMEEPTIRGAPSKTENPVPHVPLSPAVRKDTVCPFCGGENCQPMMRNRTTVKTSGYSWSSGCCGILLMGPFGLLCGLCGTGSKVNTKDETVWICQNCGKEHLSQKSALDRAQVYAVSYMITVLLVALVLSGIYHNGGLTWLILFAWAFSPLIAWGMIDGELSKALGYPLKDALPPDMPVTKYLLIAEAVTILVLLFGGPIVTNILSEL